MTGIIIPKTYIKCIEPLIFLAGPIKSAPKWRDEAVHIIASKNPNLFILKKDNSANAKEDFIKAVSNENWKVFKSI